MPLPLAPPEPSALTQGVRLQRHYRGRLPPPQRTEAFPPTPSPSRSFPNVRRGNCLEETSKLAPSRPMTERSCTPRPRHPVRPALSLLASIAAALLLLSCSVTTAEDALVLEAKVSKVLDGETFTLKGESRRIRIWGLGAPEWDHRGGSTATSTLRGLIMASTCGVPSWTSIDLAAWLPSAFCPMALTSLPK